MARYDDDDDDDWDDDPDIDGAAGEEQEVLRLVSPRLEPVGPGGNGPEDQLLEPLEGVAGKGHAQSVGGVAGFVRADRPRLRTPCHATLAEPVAGSGGR